MVASTFIARLALRRHAQAFKSRGRWKVEWRFGGVLVSEGKIVKSKFGRKKRIPGKSLITVGRAFEKPNRECAEIIMRDALSNVGLPLRWARLWLANHPPAAKKVAKVKEEQGVLF